MKKFVFFLLIRSLFAATTFMEPGGDADFLVGTTNGFWSTTSGAPAVATDFVHGGHAKSIKYRPSQTDSVITASGVLADAGTRISFYIYLNALPVTSTAYLVETQTVGSAQVIAIRLTTAGVLQLWNNGTANQIGSNGATLSTGQWYRICLSYTITSTTVNNIALFVNGSSSITATNTTLTRTGTSILLIGNASNNTALDFRSSDHYVDNSSSVTDTGNIWITAKRPYSNGTTNGFTTQIGAGGSGYGSGHAPQVNERPLSTTNGWSMVGAGSAVTEEYSIESSSAGDIDVSSATIVDFLGWVSAKSLSSETGSIIVGGSTSNISLTSTITMFKKAAGSTTYPAGGTDIGIITTTALTTVSLYESGILIAYTPTMPPPPTCIPSLAAIGAGAC